MRGRARSGWVVGLTIATCVACYGNSSSSPTAPKVDAKTPTGSSSTPSPPSRDAEAKKAIAKPCASDSDCVRPWSPMLSNCGDVKRCFDSVCIVPPAMTGEESRYTGRITFETAKGDASFGAELAQDSYATTRGLMCRESMEDTWGMLFFMPTTRVQSFWMKNTLIPLDIIFIDDTWTVVGVAADAQPQTLNSQTVGKPSRYVLELNAGIAERSGIKAGTKARFFAPAKAR